MSFGSSVLVLVVLSALVVPGAAGAVGPGVVSGLPDCEVAPDRVECGALCRVSVLDAAGPLHGHCLGNALLERGSPCILTYDEARCLVLCGVVFQPEGGAPAADCVWPARCESVLGRVECVGYCRVDYLGAEPVGGECFGNPIGQPPELPIVVGNCEIGATKTECYGYCRVSYLDGGGLVHGHCFGVPVLE